MFVHNLRRLLSHLKAIRQEEFLLTLFFTGAQEGSLQDSFRNQCRHMQTSWIITFNSQEVKGTVKFPMPGSLTSALEDMIDWLAIMGNISTLELGCKVPGLDWPLTNHAVSLVTHTAAPRKQTHDVLDLSTPCLINPGQEESVVLLESSGSFCGPNMGSSLKQRCSADIGLRSRCWLFEPLYFHNANCS